MLQTNTSEFKPKNLNELSKEIASLIADGFLAFHPTSPISEKIRASAHEFLQLPESNLTLTEILMKNCESEIKAIALSVL